MTLAVSRRTTEASRASDVLLSSDQPLLLDPEDFSLVSFPWALDLDLFARRYGDSIWRRGAGDGDGHVAGVRRPTTAAPVFEYVRPLDRCGASMSNPLTVLTASNASTPVPQLAAVLEQTAEDCSAPWMVPISQQHAKKQSKKLKRKTPRHLFQYKPYEAQETLRLSEDEMAGVVSAVFSGESSELYEARDAGIVILIKVVMDVYLEKGGDAAFGQVASLLRKPLVWEDATVAARCAVFDVLLNLMIHGELLYKYTDGVGGDASTAQETAAQEGEEEEGSWMDTVRRHTSNAACMGVECEQKDGRRGAFRAWLRRILFDLLGALAGVCDESVSLMSTDIWSAALSCVMALCTRDGFVVRAWVGEFPLSALKRMLFVARTGFWATKIQSLLACLACNVMYDDGLREADDHRGDIEDGDDAIVKNFELNRAKLDEFGGVSGVVKEYQYAPTQLACRSLFCVLLDSIGVSTGVSKAMLRSGACEVLRDYLVMPGLATDEDVNENLARAIHSVCVAAETPTKSVEGNATVEFDDVLQCIRSLKRAASEPGDLPSELAASFDATLEAGVFGQTESRHWTTLRGLLISESPKERVFGRSWMVKLMVSVLDAGVTDPKERNAIIPPPVPLLPSSVPGKTLFTFGDTILSALTHEKAQKTTQEESGRFVGDDNVVTNFALAVRQVVGGIRFRTLNIGGNLHAKWTGGGVDADRLCISTIERAFEWIMGFSSAPEWSSAVALVVESMVVVATSCSKSANVAMGLGLDRGQPPSTPTGAADVRLDGTSASISASASASEADGNSQNQTPDGPSLVPPLHIPSPSSTSAPDSTGPLSPLTKIVPGLWRRLKTPGSRSQNNRPRSSESQSSNPDIITSSSGADRPLSAGVVAMDVSEQLRQGLNISKGMSVQTSSGALKTSNKNFNPLNSGFNEAPPASRVGSVTALAHNTQWVSLADKVARVKERRIKETSHSLSSMYAAVLAYNRTVDPIESFITSTSTCPPAVLDMLSPNTLKEIFDAMNLVKVNGMSGKPFWDARLATFILLVVSCSEKNTHNHPLLKDAGYAQSLVRDPDRRVRHHACAFILRRFCEKNNEGFVKATRAIVSRAQGDNDEGLLRDPEMRVRKMMDVGMLSFDELMN